MVSMAYGELYMRRRFFTALICLFASQFAWAADDLLIKLKMVDGMFNAKLELTEQQGITLLETVREIVLQHGYQLQGVQLRSAGTVRALLSSNSSKQELDKMIATLSGDARVQSVRRNTIIQAQQWHPTSNPPNDTYWNKQTSMHQSATSNNASGINLLSAWQTAIDAGAWNQADPTGTGAAGNSGVVVAVIDTGVRYGHPDLVDRLLPGYNFVSDATNALNGVGRSANASDPGDGNAFTVNCFGTAKPAQNSSWHGTSVAGVIAAIPNNGKGVAGINGDVKILPVRALGLCGGDSADVQDAMYWSAGLSSAVPGTPTNNYPARIINMSLGDSGDCTTASTIQAIKAKTGAIIVAAAGNSAGPVGNPANCGGVVSVASLDRYGLLASYSNSGDVTISAPGGDFNGKATNLGCKVIDTSMIVTTGNDGAYEAGNHAYCNFDGTSAAAPVVSGVAALMLSINPWMSSEDLTYRLYNSVSAFPTNLNGVPSGWLASAEGSGKRLCDTGCGSGMVDAERAAKYSLLPALKIDVRALGNGEYIIDASRSHSAMGGSSLEFAWGLAVIPAAANMSMPAGSLSCVDRDGVQTSTTILGPYNSLSNPARYESSFSSASSCKITPAIYNSTYTTDTGSAKACAPCAIYVRVRDSNGIYPRSSLDAAAINFQADTGLLPDTNKRFAWEQWDQDDEKYNMASGSSMLDDPGPPGFFSGTRVPIDSALTTFTGGSLSAYNSNTFNFARTNPVAYVDPTDSSTESSNLPVASGGSATDVWSALLMLVASLLMLLGARAGYLRRSH